MEQGGREVGAAVARADAGHHAASVFAVLDLAEPDLAAVEPGRHEIAGAHGQLPLEGAFAAQLRRAGTGPGSTSPAGAWAMVAGITVSHAAHSHRKFHFSPRVMSGSSCSMRRARRDLARRRFPAPMKNDYIEWQNK